MTEVHSCSYYCDRPECIKAQRDELRDRLAQPEQGGKTGWPAGMLQDDSRELSKALASKPDAKRHAREAAQLVAQPEQEPAIQASIRRTSMGGLVGDVCWVDDKLAEGYYTLYTAPPQRKPLPPQSPCEMTQAEGKMFKLGWLECEAAHGIKGEA